MWLLLKGLAVRFAVGRSVGGLMGVLLLVLLPAAGALKLVGLPLLLVLGTLGAPVFALLGMIGLPVLFVLGLGAILMLMVGLLVTAGIVAIKIVLPIVLLVWFVRWITGRTHGATDDPPLPDEPLGPIGG
ncbi:MAG: hypothetical protein LH467_14705 [Gemmatimonadaceae bacterium]|nr:hypothetical protein [Gemmatimonadaceae bacterium]